METGTEDLEQSSDNKGLDPNIQKQVESLIKEVAELKSNKQPAAVALPIDNQENLIKQLVTELQKRPTDDNANRYGHKKYILDSEIDKDDFLTKPVTFFCHQAGYVIVDDLKQGREISTPFGNAIFFEYQFTKKKGTGRYIETYHLSVYTSRSKKEVKWLRESSYYKIYIFDSTKEAMSSDSSMAQKLSKYMARVNAMDAYKIRKACADSDLPVLKEIDQMGPQLARFWAEKELAEEEKANEFRLKQGLVETELEAEILAKKMA